MEDRFEKFSHLIFEIYRCWHRLAANEMAKYNLKGPHALYLTTIYKFNDGITAPMLCELCGKDKSDVSRMVNILIKRGLVTKESNNNSLYRGLFKLTEEGKKAAEAVRKSIMLAVENGGNGLNEETRTIFYETLGTVAENLQGMCTDGIPEE